MRCFMYKSAMLILAALFFMAGSAWAGTYSGGTGNSNDPYLIANLDDLD